MFDEKIEDPVIKEEKTDETILFKNKVDIEKELFEEFNNKSWNEISTTSDDVNKVNVYVEENKLPDISIDEYMKNFDEKEFKEPEINAFFTDDDLFPNIPI